MGSTGTQRSSLSGMSRPEPTPNLTHAYVRARAHTHTHTRHAMGAQIEAPTSEAAHCSGPTLWPPPRSKDSGCCDPSGQIPPLSFPPQSRAKIPPYSCIISLFPYRLCKISRLSLSPTQVNTKSAPSHQPPSPQHQPTHAHRPKILPVWLNV